MSCPEQLLHTYWWC